MTGYVVHQVQSVDTEILGPGHARYWSHRPKEQRIDCVSLHLVGWIVRSANNRSMPSGADALSMINVDFRGLMENIPRSYSRVVGEIYIQVNKHVGEE